MQKRLITVCHLWPGIVPHRNSPNSVWNLAWGDWVMFAYAADAYDKQQQEAAGE